LEKKITLAMLCYYAALFFPGHSYEYIFFKQKKEKMGKKKQLWIT
jgi:hypothetical protein